MLFFSVLVRNLMQSNGQYYVNSIRNHLYQFSCFHDGIKYSCRTNVLEIKGSIAIVLNLLKEYKWSTLKYLQALDISYEYTVF